MKTLFTNHGTKRFDIFSFDVLTSQELAFIKGGSSKEDDAYADPIPPKKVFSTSILWDGETKKEKI